MVDIDIFADAPTEGLALGDTGLSSYDGDTWYNKEGKGFRLQGIDALEVDTFSKQSGELGGQAQKEAIIKLANDMGFTRVVYTGEMDTTGNREIIRLEDSEGRDFSRELAKANLGEVAPGFDPGGQLQFSKEYHRFIKSSPDYEESPFETASRKVDEYIADNEQYSQQLKDAVVASQDKSYFQRTDRNESGIALNQEGVAWDTAMIGLADNAWGMASLLGDSLGIESLYGAGESGVIRAKARIADQGKILVDYKDVDSFGDAVQYLANNTIMSLPYMAMIAASSVAAPLTGGVSLLAPVSIYTGQAWNEMGEKIKFTDKERSAVTAIGSGVLQAALDYIGLKGITGSTTKELYNNAKKELMKNMTSAEADKVLTDATKRQMLSFVGDVGVEAKKQLKFKKLSVDLLKRLRNGSISEGATEGLQEAIAAISSDIGSESEINWEDVQERTVAGIVAGAALGGAFSIPGAASDAAQWANIAYGVDRENPNDVASATRYAREEEKLMEKKWYAKFRNDGMSKKEAREAAKQMAYVHSTEEIAEHFGNQAQAKPSSVGINERSAKHEADQKKRTGREVITDALGETPALWRGQVHHTFTEEILRKSRTARMMRDMFGGGLQRIFNGADFENFKHHLLKAYKGLLGEDPDNLFMQLNNGKRASKKDKERISSEIYSYVDKKGNLNQKEIDKITDPARKDLITKLIASLNILADQMHKDQKVYNPKLGKLKNYLLQYKAINKRAVYKNRSKFIQALKDTYNFSEADAVEITNKILETDMDLDEAFTVTKGGPQPMSHKRRTLGLSKQDALSEFFETDLFTNVSTAAKSAARYVANQKFVGTNGGVVSKMLDKMQQEGLTEQEVNRIAFRMKNYLDSESGNYKRPTSEFGRKLQNIQKSFMLFTMFAGLPLSTISSFVEVALGFRGLTREQIFGQKGQEGGLSKIGKEFAGMISAGMTEITNASGITNKPRTYATAGRSILNDIGFYEWDVGAATTTGVLETHSFHQKIAETYFKIIGLQGWTNFNRATRAAIAGDFIADNLFILGNRDPKSKTRTNEEREAEEKLRNLGLDVSNNGVRDLLTLLATGYIEPEKEARVMSQLREAQFSFVNEAVALPKAANRPLFYLDPRFALLNQFQGFMSTFTANHIPRLWNEYIKRGSPAMKYNTFAMMATMIMLGFASQYLKDLVKYGETSPYLDEAELIRRGVLSSGLAGTSERIIEQVFPIYETRSKNAGEWAWNTVSGESPSLSNLARYGQSISHAVKGEMPEATWDFSKAAFGPLTNVVENIYNKSDKWEF